MTTEQTDANPSTAGDRAEIDRLAERYIGVWSTADATRRDDLGSAVYAENAEFFSSEDGDLRLIGRRNILENIGKVNERDVQGHGLVVRHVGTSVNHRVVKVSWQMATASACRVSVKAASASRLVPPRARVSSMSRIHTTTSSKPAFMPCP